MDEKEEYYSTVKRAFAFLAPFYDLVTMPLSRVRNRVVDFTSARSGSRILDVGTGTGKQAFAFAEMGHDIVGIDLSEAMLNVARKNNNHENVKFMIADAATLPFEDNQFDVSCASFALHDMLSTIREKALKEMVRVTKPKGTIMIVDYTLPENRIGGFMMYHFIKLYEGKYYVEFIKSDLEALLEKTGIMIQERLPILFGSARILRGIKN